MSAIQIRTTATIADSRNDSISVFMCHLLLTVYHKNENTVSDVPSVLLPKEVVVFQQVVEMYGGIL
jgi:hypothetical protein